MGLLGLATLFAHVIMLCKRKHQNKPHRDYHGREVLNLLDSSPPIAAGVYFLLTMQFVDSTCHSRFWTGTPYRLSIGHV